MNPLIKKIEDDYNSYTKTQKLISNVLLNNDCSKMTVKTLADLSYCSPAGVMKYINKLGYRSYKVFLNDLCEQSDHFSTNILKSFDIVDKYISNNEDIYNQLCNDLNEYENVFLIAAGISTCCIIDFRKRVHNFNIKGFYTCTTKEDYTNYVTSFTKDSLVIYVSNSGEARELLYIASKTKPEKSYLITNKNNSSMQKYVDIPICLGNNLEAKFDFENKPVASKYSLMYFWDCVFETYYHIMT